MRKPTEITVCALEVVVMPNGEVICAGRFIGWWDDWKRYLTPKGNGRWSLTPKGDTR